MPTKGEDRPKRATKQRAVVVVKSSEEEGESQGEGERKGVEEEKATCRPQRKVRMTAKVRNASPGPSTRPIEIGSSPAPQQMCAIPVVARVEARVEEQSVENLRDVLRVQ